MVEPPRRGPRDPSDDETIVRDEWGPAAERVVVEEDRPVPPRRPRIWPWLLALLLLVLAGLGAAWYLTREDDEDEAAPTTITTVEEVEVPLLVGLREDRARERLDEANLVGEVERRRDAKPRGIVVEQDPEAGEEVERGDEVELVVSEGRRQTTGTTATEPETARVPEVVGMTSSDATDALREAGFDVRLVPVPSDEPDGTVVAQNPRAGAETEAGSEVRLNVAQRAASTQPTTTAEPQPEPQPATVPDVVGLELAEAARSFGQEGLKAAVRYVPSDEPQGRVVAQAQPAGTERRRGDTVQVNVSIGPQPASRASVPGVVGQSLADARATLGQAGFEVLALNLDAPVRREDQVASQSPAGGASVPRGSLVLLYVTR